MLLTSQQINEVIDIVDYFTGFFIGQNVGSDVLTKRDKLLLNSFGIDVNKLAAEGIIDHAFKFGILSAAMGHKKVKELSYMQLKAFIKSGQFLPLSPAENFALAYVKRQAYSDIKGLGNRISRDIMQVFIESSRARRLKTEKLIKKEVKAAIKDRKTVTELASALGEKTKDWTRDFDRIADYIMHDAYQQGIASDLIRQHGEDVLVFYSVYAGACEHCVRLYLKDEKTREPKVFKLSDLIANGSNIGRKAADYKPSVSPIHPWCRCTMHRFITDSVWSVEKQQYVLTRNTHGINRKSKIKITISNE